MIKRKQNSLRASWFILPVILIISLGLFVFFKGRVKPKQSEITSYRNYQNLEYGFSIEYPESWKTREDTQAFENGDIISFNITGPTQKANTDITDGARLSIAVPFAIKTNLQTWIKDYYSNKAQFSQMTFGGVTFEQVNECYIGCLTYFYTLKNGKVFGIATIAAGDDSNKMVYENALLTMLKSFKFTADVSSQLSEADAISKVKALTEVKTYLKRVPSGLVAVNGGDDTNYMVQVYEIKDGHTATFNWYSVNKLTGEIAPEFEN